MYQSSNRSSFVIRDISDVDWALYEAKETTYASVDVFQGYDMIGGPIWKWCIEDFGTLYRDIVISW